MTGIDIFDPIQRGLADYMMNPTGESRYSIDATIDKIPPEDVANIFLRVLDSNENLFHQDDKAKKEILLKLATKHDFRKDPENSPLVAFLREARKNPAIYDQEIVDKLIPTQNLHLIPDFQTALLYVTTPQLAKLFIDAGADIVAKDEDGKTPLHNAPTIEIAQLLLDSKGAKLFLEKEGTRIVNVKGSYGNTALHDALKENDIPRAKLLIDYGAKINIENSNGETPLHFSQTEEITELLLSKGAYVHATSNNNETPLHRAVISNKYDVVKSLIKAGAASDLELNDAIGNKPLHIAVNNGRFGDGRFSAGILRLLIDSGADVNSRNVRGETPLSEAYYGRNIVALFILLISGADKDLVPKHQQTFVGLDEAGKKQMESFTQGIIERLKVILPIASAKVSDLGKKSSIKKLSTDLVQNLAEMLFGDSKVPYPPEPYGKELKEYLDSQKSKPPEVIRPNTAHQTSVVHSHSTNTPASL